MSEYRGLDTVLLDRGDLLVQVEGNYAKHRDKFEEAMAGYKELALKYLNEQIERIKFNAPEQVIVSLPMPEDHSDDYQRVIEMLKWSEDTTLELNEQEFSTYVLDQWGWQQGFAQTYAMYSGK